MPGIRIKISTEEAQTLVKKLDADLTKLGATTKLTTAQMTDFSKKAINKAELDAGAAAIDRVAKSIGMTEKEVKKFKLSLEPTSFSKSIETTFQSIKSHWMSLSMAAVAAGMTISKALDLMAYGAKSQQASDTFKAVAKSMGEDSYAIVNAMKAVSAGTVSNTEITQKAIKGMMMGFKGDEMIKIMEMARLAARVTGEDVAEAYEKITDSIATNMPRSLKQYGLITKEQMAIVNKAISAGVEDLNLLKVAEANYQVQIAKTGPLVDNAKEAFQRYHVQVSAAKSTMGKALLEGVAPLMPSIKTLGEVLMGVLIPALGLVAIAVNSVVSTLQGLAMVAVGVGVIILNTYAKINKAIAYMQRLFGFEEAAASTEKFVADVEAEMENLKGAMMGIADDVSRQWGKSEKEKTAFSKEEAEKRRIQAEEERKKWEEQLKQQTREETQINQIKEAEAARFATVKAGIDNEVAIYQKRNELLLQQEEIKYRKSESMEEDFLRRKLEIQKDNDLKVLSGLQKELKATEASFAARIAVIPTTGPTADKHAPELKKTIAERETVLEQLRGKIALQNLQIKKDDNDVALLGYDITLKKLGVEKDILGMRQQIATSKGSWDEELKLKLEILEVERKTALAQPGLSKDRIDAINALYDEKKLREPILKQMADQERLLTDLNRRADTAASQGDLQKEWSLRNEILDVEREKLLLTAGLTDAQKEIIKNLYEEKKLRSGDKIIGSQIGVKGTELETAKKSGKISDALRAEQELLNLKIKQTQEAANLSEAEKKAQIESLQFDKSHSTLLKDYLDQQAGFYDKLIGFEDKYREAKLAWIDAEQERLAEYYGDDVAAAKWAAQAKGELDQQIFETKSKQVDDALGQMASAFTAIGNMYDKNSSEYARMQDAAKAMAALQQAVAVANAVAAIANQGLGDPYTAFARIAAMAAAMGALLSSTGLSLGGAATQSRAAYGENTTVFGGANDQGSESVKNSFDLLEETYSMEYEKLSGILEEMKALNDNITGLVTNVVRIGVGGTNWNVPGLELSQARGFFDKGLFDPIGKGAQWLEKLSADTFKNIPVVSQLSMIASRVSTFLMNLPGKIWSALFGGDTSSELTASGLLIPKGINVAGLQSGRGVSGLSYGTIKTTTDGGWFGRDSEDFSVQTKALGALTNSLLTSMFKSISGNLMTFAEGFGTDIGKVLSYTFDEIQINLLGKTPAEMTEIIQNKFSEIADIAVEKLFGEILIGYQKIGEGLMETAVRLIVDKEVVLETLEKTRQGFASVTAMKAVELSETLITLAGSLEDLTDAASKYYDKFFTDGEKYINLQKDLTEALTAQNLTLPTTREGYRNLVEAQNLLTEEGRAAYVALLQLSESADSFYSTMEDVESSRSDLEIQIMEAQGKSAEALVIKRRQELEAMDASLRPLQQIINAFEDWKNQIAESTDAVMAILDEMTSGAQEALSKAQELADSYRQITQSIRDAQTMIIGGDYSGTKTRLMSTYRTAMTGDQKSLAALPQLAQDFMSLSLTSSKSLVDYNRDKAQTLRLLKDAETVSVAMTNWAEYQATLLESQLEVLENIREELQKEDPSVEYINGQVKLLKDVSGLLGAVTVQILDNQAYIIGSTGALEIWKNAVVTSSGAIATLTGRIGEQGLAGALSGTILASSSLSGKIDSLALSADGLNLKISGTIASLSKFLSDTSISASVSSFIAAFSDASAAIDIATLDLNALSLYLLSPDGTINAAKLFSASLLNDDGTINAAKLFSASLLNDDGTINASNLLTLAMSGNVSASSLFSSELLSPNGTINASKLFAASLIDPTTGTIYASSELAKVLLGKDGTIKAASVLTLALGGETGATYAITQLAKGLLDPAGAIKAATSFAYSLFGDKGAIRATDLFSSALLNPDGTINASKLFAASLLTPGGTIDASKLLTSTLTGEGGTIKAADLFAASLLNKDGTINASKLFATSLIDPTTGTVYASNQLSKVLLDPNGTIDAAKLLGIAIGSSNGTISAVDLLTSSLTNPDGTINAAKLLAQAFLNPDGTINAAKLLSTSIIGETGAVSSIESLIRKIGGEKGLTFSFSAAISASDLFTKSLSDPATGAITSVSLLSSALGLSPNNGLVFSIRTMSGALGDLITKIATTTNPIDVLNSKFGELGGAINGLISLINSVPAPQPPSPPPPTGGGPGGSGGSGGSGGASINNPDYVAFMTQKAVADQAFQAMLDYLNPRGLQLHLISNADYSKGNTPADFEFDYRYDYEVSAVDRLFDLYDAEYDKAAALWRNGFPTYAEGGDHPGGFRIVGEKGPEIEYTGASTILSNKKSKALVDNSELIDEIRNLRNDMKAGNYSIAKNQAKMTKILDRWDVDGQPAERTI